MIKRWVALALLGASGCDSTCPRTAALAAGPPVVAVGEKMADEMRQAGFRDGELKTVVAGLLAAQGLQLAEPGAEGNVSVDVDLRLFDRGDAYVGIIRLAVREPATLWSNASHVRAITGVHEYVFASPKATAREYVLGKLRDSVRELVAQNQRLQG